MKFDLRTSASAVAMAIAAMAPQAVSAQDDDTRSAAEVLRDVILVTGTKKADAENEQKDETGK